MLENGLLAFHRNKFTKRIGVLLNQVCLGLSGRRNGKVAKGTLAKMKRVVRPTCTSLNIFGLRSCLLQFSVPIFEPRTVQREPGKQHLN